MPLASLTRGEAVRRMRRAAFSYGERREAGRKRTGGHARRARYARAPGSRIGRGLLWIASEIKGRRPKDCENSASEKMGRQPRPCFGDVSPSPLCGGYEKGLRFDPEPLKCNLECLTICIYYYEYCIYHIIKVEFQSQYDLVVICFPCLRLLRIRFFATYGIPVSWASVDQAVTYFIHEVVEFTMRLKKIF